MFKLPYFLEGISNIFKPVLTNEESLDDMKGVENYRGKLKFNADVCIGCGICMRVCAANAITRTVEKVEGGQEITMSFDLTSCTFCGLCKDFCSKKAIDLTDEIIMVANEKEELSIGGKFIKKLPPKPQAKQKTVMDKKENNKEVVKKTENEERIKK